MPKYTAQQFINAIPDTGGVISALADRVGCDWHTAKKYVTEYATVQKAWEAEKNKVTDAARNNVVRSIVDDEDLQTSKWWLQLMADEFIPKSKKDITTDGEPLQPNIIRVVVHSDGDADSDGA